MSKTETQVESALGKNWKCPYCGAHQVLLDARYDKGEARIKADASIHDKTALLHEVRVCANQDCRKMALSVWLVERQDLNDGLGTFKTGKAIGEWSLMPSPAPAKALSEKIDLPDDVRADYALAQKLCEISPAAAAAYARRALGGMLKDFCGIARDRLVDQIAALKAMVRKGRAPQWCDGLAEIERVMASGDIAKHMEARRDTMVDADAVEVDKLLGLLDQLAEDWYAVRHRRRSRNPAADCCRPPAPAPKLLWWR